MFGYYREKDDLNLLYPDLLFNAVRSYYSKQGILFPWSKMTMCTQLRDQGFLYATGNQNRTRLTRKDPRTNKEIRFLAIPSDKIQITCRYNEQGYILTK